MIVVATPRPARPATVIRSVCPAMSSGKMGVSLSFNRTRIRRVTKILDQMQDQFPDRSTPYLVAYPFGHFWGAMRLLFAEKKDVTRDVH